jgi:hypothetical protein
MTTTTNVPLEFEMRYIDWLWSTVVGDLSITRTLLKGKLWLVLLNQKWYSQSPWPVHLCHRRAARARCGSRSPEPRSGAADREARWWCTPPSADPRRKAPCAKNHSCHHQFLILIPLSGVGTTSFHHDKDLLPDFKTGRQLSLGIEWALKRD